MRPALRAIGAALLFAGTTQGLALAQTSPSDAAAASSPADTYTPSERRATNPMRVVVLTPTTFQDVETRQTYRLYGIDACEAGQTATLGKQTWPCGVVATAWLVTATLNRWVVCSPIRRDGAVIVGRCATGDLPDIAADMLKAGVAVTLPADSDRLIPAYAQLERDARKAYRGLWASSFQMPWLFRRSSPQTP